MSIKEQLIDRYMEEHTKLENRPGELERADREWKAELHCDRFCNAGAMNAIDEAAYLLAGSYETAGLEAGFDMACRMFAEIFAAALKGGASA